MEAEGVGASFCVESILRFDVFVPRMFFFFCRCAAPGPAGVGGAGERAVGPPTRHVEEAARHGGTGSLALPSAARQSCGLPSVYGIGVCSDHGGGENRTDDPLTLLRSERALSLELTARCRVGYLPLGGWVSAGAHHGEAARDGSLSRQASKHARVFQGPTYTRPC